MNMEFLCVLLGAATFFSLVNMISSEFSHRREVESINRTSDFWRKLSDEKNGRIYKLEQTVSDKDKQLRRVSLALLDIEEADDDNE